MDQQQDSSWQDVERIIRKAEDLGLDAHRVACALDHKLPRPGESEVVVEVERRSGVRARARRFVRGSPG
jgi:hypothetical protein